MTPFEILDNEYQDRETLEDDNELMSELEAINKIQKEVRKNTSGINYKLHLLKEVRYIWKKY